MKVYCGKEECKFWKGSECNKEQIIIGKFGDCLDIAQPKSTDIKDELIQLKKDINSKRTEWTNKINGLLDKVEGHN